MGCSFEVYSLMYKGTEVGCRVNLMVDGEAFCALDFREPAQKFASGKGVKGTLEVKEVNTYLLTEDEINGTVDVLDATENKSASDYVYTMINSGTSPNLGVFFYLCISNYINYVQRLDKVDFKLEFSTEYMLFRYKGTGYIVVYDNTSVEDGSHLVTVGEEQHRDRRIFSFKIKEGTASTKQGFLRDCSRTVKLLQKEVLK